MNILLVGDPTDLTSAWIGRRAAARGLTALRVDEEALGVDVHLRNDHLVIHRRTIPTDDVAAVFVRLAPAPGAPASLGMNPDEAAWFVAERRAGLRAWIDQLAVPVVNPSWAGLDNASKPMQLQRLARAGFTVPPWVMTQSAEVARDFVARHGTSLVKSASGLRAAIRAADDSVIELLHAGAVPVLIQQHIQGDDVRVHVLGDQLFAAVRGQPRPIRSSGSDNDDYAPSAVPPALHKPCLRWVRDAGLVLAGFDFRVDESGTWHALEVNPCPTLLPYELTTGVPLCDRLLDVVLASTPSRALAHA